MNIRRITTLLVVCVGGMTGVASAQPSSRSSEAGAPQRRPAGHDGMHRLFGEGELLGEYGFLGTLRSWRMRPNASDDGPVGPGELDQLLDFARTEIPPLFRALSDDRERDPQAFPQRFARVAPSLRFLRRMIASEPEMGRAMVDHAQSHFRTERLRRVLVRGLSRNAPGFDRERAERALREAVAQKADAEVRILRLQSDALSRMHAELVEDALAVIGDPKTDLSAMPPRMRDAARELQDARAAQAAAVEAADRTAAAERVARIETEIRNAVGRRLDDEIRTRRDRADKQAANLPNEVDARMSRIVAAAEEAAHRPNSHRVPPAETEGEDGD